ncbi:MAG: SIS domain-containing protein [Anaerolineae bacterium]|nr:SIS domain-containing protein [Anaerolineae bacterium]MBN8618739.1 SIS domain-containing protein [Anaerolineae bacterium]
MDSKAAALAYMDAAQKITDAIRATQMDKIEAAAQVCADSIGQGGLAHLFGTGHSRIPVEEIFPRHGSFPGFHPIIDLSLTFHTQVVGANGQRQAMLIEKMEGLGEAILRNFVFRTYDCFLIFSNSGVNNVIMEVALGAKARGMKVISVVSMEHCLATAARHKSGLRLPDVSDITIDNCTPSGDALVKLDGLDYPVGPGSTIGYALIVNALKVAVAQKLTAMGQPPLVLTSGVLIGSEESATLFERTYDDYRERVKKVYGG